MLLEVSDGVAKTRIPSMLGSDVLMKQTLRPECQCRTRIWVERRADGDVDHPSAEECANILEGGLHFRTDSNNLWFSSHWDVDTSRRFLEMLITEGIFSMEFREVVNVELSVEIDSTTDLSTQGHRERTSMGPAPGRDIP